MNADQGGATNRSVYSFSKSLSLPTLKMAFHDPVDQHYLKLKCVCKSPEDLVKMQTGF